MKYIIIFVLLISFNSVFATNDIAKINAIKKQGELAFKSGDFEKVISNYSYLIDTLHLQDQHVILNLAHAYCKTGRKQEAQSQYQKLVYSKDGNLKSLAYQQLGTLSDDPKTLEKALAYFKASIKSDPSNEDSRYNYELVKKRLKNQQEKNKDKDQKSDKNEEKNNKEDQSSKEEKNKENQKEGENQKDEKKKGEEKESEEEKKESEKSEKEKKGEQKKVEQGQEDEDKPQPQPPSASDKMKEIKISPEKAKMILEALKNNEMQYIQQNQRKPTKRKDNDKPDW